MTLIGAVMVLGSGAYLVSLFARGQKTYSDLEPQPDPNKDDPSGKVVFIVLAVLVISIGFLVLGLGVLGLLKPAETMESSALQSRLVLSQFASFGQRG